jgi:hypothetical protein
MLKIGVLLIYVLLLMSCRTPMVYPLMVKDGATEHQRKTDAFECKAIAADFRSKMATGAGGSAGVISGGRGVIGPGPAIKTLNIATEAANEYYIECMELRGYKIVPEKENK